MIMKKNLLFKSHFFLMFGVLLLSACSSKEDNATETIKNEMFKTLYDFNSYEPIETTFDSLKKDKYGDTLIFSNVMMIKYAMDDFDKAKKEFDDARETSEIYRPTPYASSFSSKKYIDAQETMNKCYKDMNFYISIMDSLYIVVKELEKKCDGQFYGWFVTHKYRCKTKGGSPTIGTNYYFMDKDCKKVYRYFDDDDFSLENYKSLVDDTLKPAENE